MKDRRATYLLCVAVVAIAAGYFLLTYNRTVNPIDEGLLLYNFQKTAAGQVPHRDFYDVYGPGAYWVGGALFKMFGARIMVVRIFLLILKTMMALLVFLVARKLLPAAFAFIAAALFILNWGDPYFPAINILYAGHCSHMLILLAILLTILYVENGSRSALAGAGICLGLTMLFKFHTGIIGTIGFAVFFSLKEQASGIGDKSAEDPGSNGSMSTLLRAAKCLGAISVGIFYLLSFHRYHLDIYYFLLFLFPIFFLLGHIIVEDLRRFRTDKADARSFASLKTCYTEIIILLSGPLVVVALEIAYFRMVGGLDEFLYDTFRLPLHLDYYRQMADYRFNAIVVACLVLSALILTAIGNGWRWRNEAARRVFWAGCLLSMLVLAVAPIVRSASLEALRDRSVLILSPATLLLSSYVLVAAWRKEKVSGGNTRETLSLALVFILACQGLIMSFPRTDAAHIQINNTTVFILISFLLWRMYAGWVSFLQKGRRIPATVSVAAGVAVVAAAAVWSMKAFLLYIPAETTFGEQGRKTIASPPTIELGFPRARGVEIPMWFEPHFPGAWIDLSNVIRYVRNNSEADETIFLLCEPQIVYFLSERKSFLQKENYFVHLGAMGLIDSADDVRLTDDQLLEKLIDAKPRFIIRAPAGVHTARIIRLWPKTAAYIDRNYAPTKKISSVYQVLRPRLQEETPAR